MGGCTHSRRALLWEGEGNPARGAPVSRNSDFARSIRRICRVTTCSQKAAASESTNGESTNGALIHQREDSDGCVWSEAGSQPPPSALNVEIAARADSVCACARSSAA